MSTKAKENKSGIVFPLSRLTALLQLMPPKEMKILLLALAKLEKTYPDSVTVRFGFDDFERCGEEFREMPIVANALMRHEIARVSKNTPEYCVRKEHYHWLESYGIDSTETSMELTFSRKLIDGLARDELFNDEGWVVTDLANPLDSVFLLYEYLFEAFADAEAQGDYDDKDPFVVELLDLTNLFGCTADVDYTTFVEEYLRPAVSSINSSSFSDIEIELGNDEDLPNENEKLSDVGFYIRKKDGLNHWGL